jgi:hypothetical protein
MKKLFSLLALPILAILALAVPSLRRYLKMERM